MEGCEVVEIPTSQLLGASESARRAKGRRADAIMAGAKYWREDAATEQVPLM